MSMFSVDINSASGANYIRPKKGGNKRVVTQHTPVNMTRNGSVFNDPNIFTTEPTNVKPANIKTLGRQAVVAQRGGNSIFNGQINFISGGSGTTPSDGGLNSLTSGLTPGFMGTRGGVKDDLGIGRDPSKGRAAAKKLKGETSDLRSGIVGVEGDAKSAEKVKKQAKKLGGKIKKDDAKFKERAAIQKAQIKSLEAERKATIDEMNYASKSINQYAAELDAEVNSGANNFERIATLRSLIRDKNSTIMVGQLKVNVIGRSSKSLITDMNKTTVANVKANKTNQKNIESNQSEMNKTVEVAENIAAIAGIVETSGAILENLGLMFKACASIPFVGAALAAAGAVMEPIGKTAKTVGQWGQTAAQITQTVALAADGQLMAAFMCAASSLQSLSSSISSTKEMASGWKDLGVELKNVKADAADAKAKRAEAKAAKAEKKEMKKGTAKTETDKDGNRTTSYSDETSAKRDAATAARKEADQARLDANYKQAKSDLKRANLSKEDYNKKLADLDNEYKQLSGNIDNGVKGSNSKLLAGTSLEASTTTTSTENGKTDKTGGKDKKAGSKNNKKANAKAKNQLKSQIRKILFKDGLAFVGQALSLAGSICALTQSGSSSCSGNTCGSKAQISRNAQKIVAKTMSRMGYTRPGMFKVKTR